MGCTQSSAQAPCRLKALKSATCPPLPSDTSTADSLDSQSLGGLGDLCGSAIGPRKLFTDGQKATDKLVGVIVTIFDGSSYDAMFREIMPTSVPGERISTYSISCIDIGKLHIMLAATAPIPDNEDDVWRCVVEDVRQVPPDSVVFNWECCSGCGDHAFPCSAGQHGLQGTTPQFQNLAPSPTMQFMGFALRSGFTVMCSDFSLKSLIHEWSEEQLGPNPFLQVGSCDHQFCLEFIPSELQSEEVPQQLQVVGELCADKGKAVVTAMGNTILYTVNPLRKSTDLYELKVLTVVTDYAPDHSDPRSAPVQEEAKCSIGDADAQKKGLAGHVTLTYAEGGQLVTSMGHWIELARLDATLDSVMRAAEHNFGEEEVNKFRREYDHLGSATAKSAYLQETCQQLVTKSAPTRMKLRTKY